MTRYLALVEKHLKKLDEWIIKQVSQEDNENTNTLVEPAATFPINGTVMLPIYLKITSSITPRLVCNIG